MLENYVALDLEMTGLSAKKDRILEIGAVKIIGKKTVGTYGVLLNPGCPIPKHITELTGITQEMAEHGEKEEKAMEGLLEFLGELPLVGHNILCDYGFLRQWCVNKGICMEKSAVDTLKLSRKFLDGLPGKTLEAVCSYYKITRAASHRALDDAIAAWLVYECLEREFCKTNPSAFLPCPLVYKAKKQAEATPRQKKYLKELAEYHKIELKLPDMLTKSGASRMTDQIIRQYGRKPKA